VLATTPNPSPLVPRDPQLLAIAEALSAPFEAKDIKFKPQMVKNNRALAMAYIDARLIQDRLDRVLGVENWQDTYEILPDGSVMCRLKLKLGSRWITKTDVGSPSEQPDSGNRLKAAFSDALKRAAVKFGVGRYLYRLHAQWVDYDPIKKQLAQLPHLPASALPKTIRTGSSEGIQSETSERMKDEDKGVNENPVASSSLAPHPSPLPKSGQELHKRLQDYDTKLASRKLCVRGALLAHVTQAGVKAGYTANMTDWSGPAIPFAVEVVREFEQSMRASGKSEPKTAA
jgi:hypothetical protein